MNSMQKAAQQLIETQRMARRVLTMHPAAELPIHFTNTKQACGSPMTLLIRG